MEINLKQIFYGGVTLQIPEVWTAETDMYDEPDGRQCACIDISAEEGDIRSIMISYGPMPEGSDALMEAEGTFEEFMDDIDTAEEEPIFSCTFKEHEAYGFDFKTEDGAACCFLCIGVEKGEETKLLTILTSASDEEELDSLLAFIEEYISIQ